MILTPELEGDAKAQMRLAFTRSCRNFPRLDMAPIHLALYQVYADVAYFIGSTYVLHEPGMAKEIVRFLPQIQDDLLAKKSNELVAMGLSQMEAKKIRGLTLGLDETMSRVLVDFYRNSHSPGVVQVRRNALLTTRRNMLANDWTNKAMEAAKARFETADRGETSYGESRAV